MNGAQDLGGQMGFGPVAPEVDEPIFHEPWERRALGLVLAANGMGHWPGDESRHTRECLHPADYLASSYYEIWIKALEKLLQRHGFVSAAELDCGVMLAPAPKPNRVLLASMVPGVLAKGAAYDRHLESAPLFKTGDAVRTVLIHPSGHTRLPRYARDKPGRIETVRGAFVFPDSNAHGQGEAPQWLYTVVFEGRALWGKQADPTLSVSVDAFESYLESA
jgi:nitrile hydratase subunit beta